MPTAKLRHLAFTARDAVGLAHFYRDQFGMRIFHTDPDGSQFLTDGVINLAIIQQALDGDVPTGFNHFGFHVDDVDTVAKNLVDAGLPEPAVRHTTRPFAEYRAIDPEGNWFDLSAHGYLPPGEQE
ncbi:VOC family protein [Kutzneria buriramensis]|uniref:Glyoxalase/bleomycin resistance protein/dioxygenase superfamily protein n=1 Tax=Kutzneria buriramensis TaxID=1045776 RepID=A0A3E0H0K4_9PSEU|nr:VOC family protein [Kutzneria buriramensis]REH35364.1 glyoxalase/bleomycin resistance protein/dioxygenase superfamily protein [Kutzneria buriramensis]